ncbi:MAG: hypothetical protein JSW47_06465 [Phycisphaerales bacterium]|nr:MAG: hypothetical protein JSW47_06465 [Phycisphaerales bacterium]
MSNELEVGRQCASSGNGSHDSLNEVIYVELVGRRKLIMNGVFDLGA